jgi:hypothetical protein
MVTCPLAQESLSDALVMPCTSHAHFFRDIFTQPVKKDELDYCATCGDDYMWINYAMHITRPFVYTSFKSKE